MARGTLRIALALLLTALVVACGRRETDAPPGQPPTATAYQQVQISATAAPVTPIPLQPDELTAAAAVGALQQTEQALSLLLTASPASAEGYTAIALYETARAAVTAGAIPPEQRRPTLDPTRLAGLPTPTPTDPPPPFTPGPDQQNPGIDGMLQTGQAATATRAADYTATAITAGGPGAAATATARAALGTPTPTPAAAPPGALRFYLPPDLEARYIALNPQSGADAYYVALVPRGEEPRPGNTITLSGGLQAEAIWRENQPGGLGAVIEQTKVRGVRGTLASSGFGVTVSWQEDGQAYAVSYAADGDTAEALAFVEALVAIGRDGWDAAMRSAQQ